MSRFAALEDEVPPVSEGDNFDESEDEKDDFDESEDEKELVSNLERKVEDQSPEQKIENNDDTDESEDFGLLTPAEKPLVGKPPTLIRKIEPVDPELLEQFPWLTQVVEEIPEDPGYDVELSATVDDSLDQLTSKFNRCKQTLATRKQNFEALDVTYKLITGIERGYYHDRKISEITVEYSDRNRKVETCHVKIKQFRDEMYFRAQQRSLCLKTEFNRTPESFTSSEIVALQQVISENDEKIDKLKQQLTEIRKYDGVTQERADLLKAHTEAKNKLEKSQAKEKGLLAQLEIFQNLRLQIMMEREYYQYLKFYKLKITPETDGVDDRVDDRERLFGVCHEHREDELIEELKKKGVKEFPMDEKDTYDHDRYDYQKSRCRRITMNSSKYWKSYGPYEGGCNCGYFNYKGWLKEGFNKFDTGKFTIRSTVPIGRPRRVKN
jgi:hypothetical protein